MRRSKRVGLPAVLKTCRLGYDGKGQWLLRTAEDVDRARAELPNVPLILEKFVAFTRELSILGVRSRTGEIVFYPLVENHHRGGILRLSLAPAPQLAPGLQQTAEQATRKILEALDYAGVICLELFQVGDKLLANEIAPRVHNSGHWSIEGAATSQFENHLRAILGMPLGSTATVGYSAMVNLIAELPEAAEVLRAAEHAPASLRKIAAAGKKTWACDGPRRQVRKIAATASRAACVFPAPRILPAASATGDFGEPRLSLGRARGCWQTDTMPFKYLASFVLRFAAGWRCHTLPRSSPARSRYVHGRRTGNSCSTANRFRSFPAKCTMRASLALTGATVFAWPKPWA